MADAPLSYDADRIERFYDAYGDQEWNRFDHSPMDRVNLAVHQRFLADHLVEGMRILDIGAGPGRFTIQAVELGATVVVGDISTEMLRQNAARVADAGAEHGVEQRLQLDVTDLSSLATGTFDAVICFGGPISYALNQAETAVRELLRVTRPEGIVVTSVMSVLGAGRIFLPGVLADAVARGFDHSLRIFRTGELPEEVNNHQLKMYRWTELARLIERAGGQIVDSSAANFLTPGHTDAINEHVERIGWDGLLDLEVELCREPGVIDAGTHILTAFRHPQS